VSSLPSLSLTPLTPILQTNNLSPRRPTSRSRPNNTSLLLPNLHLRPTSPLHKPHCPHPLRKDTPPRAAAWVYYPLNRLFLSFLHPLHKTSLELRVAALSTLDRPFPLFVLPHSLNHLLHYQRRKLATFPPPHIRRSLPPFSWNIHLHLLRNSRPILANLLLRHQFLHLG
jgi:hypothetical protein